MKEAKFRAILEEIYRHAEEVVRSQTVDMYRAPSIDIDQLNEAQAEIWRRIGNVVGAGGVGIHHEPYDEDFEVCQELYVADAKYVCRITRDYLDGKLTNPRQLAMACYQNQTRHSVSLAVWLEDSGMPCVRSTVTESGRELAAHFNKSAKRYDSVSDIQFPKELGGYTLNSSDTKIWLFEEEL